ncbi:3-hydroxy-9,10-secoandrosta-1,3,5(10)-triene-9,17-dione monooxygenase oxygenase subunit [Nocardioides sp. zg-DK7169]|uniref:3-hydroxy-9,10-secoandrosta-1,3,5(10)-triene-9, 17-dione monooxygenase oxygenase subunit n=1 Tax=Nocardioides sp. zg-DK7169 TaxID=2736600 RepID=UPI001552A814|nr:3-hydroxy-9,10-secoandrosta-1,3,5(10)-triene-9,17-dione monooxygenase oxygenase subunit [Nocardioides sp. zg-DK7169]NPC98698.1 flavin-dependent monooxygenase [Nocardioides sp. zg-DK7169]
MSTEVFEAVTDLLPTLAERADQAEADRRISAETMADLAATGVFRMLQPRRFGGMESDPSDFYRAVRTISTACGSTGWVSAVVGCHPWQIALFPDQAQREVWGEDPGRLIASSYAPVGRLTPAGDGFRLSGRWSFASGCDHAAWLTLGALVVGTDGRPVDFLTVLVPREDAEILDVWDSVGLTGTGSNDVVVDDVQVPAHRVLRNYDVSHMRAPGLAVNPGPLYRMPFGTIFTTAVTTPVVGTVEGAYEAYLTAMRDRMRLSFGGGRFAEDAHAQVAVARAASEIDAAILQLERNVREMYEAAVAGTEIPMHMRFRARRDQVRATERALGAVDVLFKTAGGASLRRGNRIERAWRDAHAGSVHVANDVERALAMYGKFTFGLQVEDNLV